MKIIIDDLSIFEEAKKRNAIILTKDEDFIELLRQRSSPPKIIWVTCGNTSNQRMKEVLLQHLENALHLLKAVDLVEITD